MDRFCQLLRLWGGSGLGSRSLGGNSTHLIEIEECKSLSEAAFPVQRRVKTIFGFQKCQSLYRTGIPSSIEVVGAWAFYECASLNEIAFSSAGHLKEIAGFGRSAEEKQI
jgi:hypothetical protein